MNVNQCPHCVLRKYILSIRYKYLKYLVKLKYHDFNKSRSNDLVFCLLHCDLELSPLDQVLF